MKREEKNLEFWRYLNKALVALLHISLVSCDVIRMQSYTDQYVCTAWSVISVSSDRCSNGCMHLEVGLHREREISRRTHLRYTQLLLYNCAAVRSGSQPTGGPRWLHHYLNHLWMAFSRVTTVWGTVLPAQSCRAASHLLQLFPGQVEREDTVQCLFTCRYCDGDVIGNLHFTVVKPESHACRVVIDDIQRNRWLHSEQICTESRLPCVHGLCAVHLWLIEWTHYFLPTKWMK